MTIITILVSAFERYEQPTEVAGFALESVDLEKGLSVPQMTKMLELLQPELEKRDLTLYRNLNLEYLVDGVPKMQQRWTNGPVHRPVTDVSVPLSDGSRLALEFTMPSTTPMFEL